VLLDEGFELGAFREDEVEWISLVKIRVSLTKLCFFENFSAELLPVAIFSAKIIRARTVGALMSGCGHIVQVRAHTVLGGGARLLGLLAYVILKFILIKIFKRLISLFPLY